MAGMCHCSIAQPQSSAMSCQVVGHTRLRFCQSASGHELTRPGAPSLQRTIRRPALLRTACGYQQRRQLRKSAASQSTGDVKVAFTAGNKAVCELTHSIMHLFVGLHHLGARHDKDQGTVCVQRYAYNDQLLFQLWTQHLHFCVSQVTSAAALQLHQS